MHAIIIILIIIILLALVTIAYVFYARWSAEQAGLPLPPFSSFVPFTNRTAPTSTYPVAPRPSGPLAWIQDKYASLRASRAGAGYTGTRARRGGAGGGFGALDPDGAWDDRVGSEADAYHGLAGAGYEEQELGLHPVGGAGHYGGGGYGGRDAATLPAYGEERGRRRSRDDKAFVGGGQQGLNQRYDEEVSGNPFADGPSLRGMSPRPVELRDGTSISGPGSRHAREESGESVAIPMERKSMFREAM